MSDRNASRHPFRLYKVTRTIGVGRPFFFLVEALSFDDAAKRVRQWDRLSKIESVEEAPMWELLPVGTDELGAVKFEAHRIGLGEGD